MSQGVTEPTLSVPSLKLSLNLLSPGLGSLYRATGWTLQFAILSAIATGLDTRKPVWVRSVFPRT